MRKALVSEAAIFEFHRKYYSDQFQPRLPFKISNYMKKKEKTPTLVLNICLLVFVLVVMLCVSEVVVRIFYKDTTVMFPRYHTDAVYGDYTLRKIRPNSNFFHTSIDGNWEFTTNSQGFRNYKDFVYEKPEGLIRIVSLGDSHTQGYEVHLSSSPKIGHSISRKWHDPLHTGECHEKKQAQLTCDHQIDQAVRVRNPGQRHLSRAGD